MSSHHLLLQPFASGWRHSCFNSHFRASSCDITIGYNRGLRNGYFYFSHVKKFWLIDWLTAVVKSINRSDRPKREEVRTSVAGTRPVFPAERRWSGCRETADRWIPWVGRVPIPFCRRARTTASAPALAARTDRLHSPESLHTPRVVRKRKSFS